MVSASQLLYQWIGSPKVKNVAVIEPSRCWVCGGAMAEGILRTAWVSHKFTDYSRVRGFGGAYVCSACVYLMALRSPVLGRSKNKGKQMAGSFRNYSHMLDADGYANFTKGEKSDMLSWLKREHKGPWFAAIAETGQKHIVPFCTVNPSKTSQPIVLFDSLSVRLPYRTSFEWGLVDDIAALLNIGIPKKEIEQREYSSRAWKTNAEWVEKFEDKWASYRGGAWFRLALWLAYKEEYEAGSK